MAAAGKALAAIHELMKRGVSPNEVYRQTGMKQGIDGKWLDMSQQARMGRASEQGYAPTYHGTTAEIPESGFRMTGSAESDLGRGIYSSTSPYDASRNYAEVEYSQDLQGKIERLAEQIADDRDIPYEQASQAAKSQLVQSPNVMPTMARTKNPVRIGGADETRFDLEMKYDTDETWDEAEEAIREEYAEEIAEGDYDADEIKELITERATEIADENGYVDEGGTLAELAEGMRNVSHRFDDIDVDQAIQDVMENYPDGAGAEELIDALKQSEGLAYATTSDTGELASGEFIRQAFEDAGYDSIIDATPNKKWGSEAGRSNFMQDLEGTEHVIVFDPSQMRSKFAAFDPSAKDSANLLAGIGGLGVGIGAMGQSGEAEAGLGGNVASRVMQGVKSAPTTDFGGTLKLSSDAGSLTIKEGAKYSPSENSIVDFVVDESKRGKGEGDKLLKQAAASFSDIGGQVSSPASLKVFYNNGFRPFDMEDAPFEKVLSEFNKEGGSLFLRSVKSAAPLTTGGLLGLGALSSDNAMASSTGTIEAAKYPMMQTAADYMDKLELPIVGKPLQGIADWARGVAYDDPDKLKRAAVGAMDLM